MMLAQAGAHPADSPKKPKAQLVAEPAAGLEPELLAEPEPEPSREAIAGGATKTGEKCCFKVVHSDDGLLSPRYYESQEAYEKYRSSMQVSAKQSLWHQS